MKFSINTVTVILTSYYQVQAVTSGKSSAKPKSSEEINESKSSNWTGPWNVIGGPTSNMPSNGEYPMNNQPGYPMNNYPPPPNYPPPMNNPPPSYSPPNYPPPSNGKVIRCGVDFGNALCPMETGGCCSKDGYCGSSVYFCHTEAKCQSGCWNPSPPLGYSVNGLCGILNKGLPCDPNGFYGPCCSKFGYCGFTQEHCRA